MIDPLEYFKGFQINHFDYKQLVNQWLLELNQKDAERIIAPVTDGSIEEFRRTVKMDTRLTFLLAAETLFELVFALLPKDGKVEDWALMQNLARKTFHSHDIRAFAHGETGKLDALDLQLEYSDGKKNSVLRHIFYFGLRQEEHDNPISASLLHLKEILKILASELQERQELNSYKHGFRGIPRWKSFTLMNPETKEEMFNFDFSDSITIFSEDQKKGTIEMLTKNFDPTRDMELTHLIGHLIGNIINPRKLLSKSAKGGAVRFFFFEEGNVNAARKINVSADNMRITQNKEGM